MKILINIDYEKIYKKKWIDTIKRVKHLAERMKLRGIDTDHIKEAVKKGAKKLRSDGTIVTEFRWYKIIYREFNLKNIKKIYPITVIGD